MALKDCKVLFFSGENCGACKMIKPQIEKVKEFYDVINYDSKENKNVMEMYGISRIPSIVITHDDDIIGSFSGFKDSGFILDFIELNYLKKDDRSE